MKRMFLLLTIVSCSLISQAQYENSKQIFSSPKLKEAIKSHKTVAILPFETIMSYKKPPANFNAEVNRQKEQSMAKSIQSSMYTFYFY